VRRNTRKNWDKRRSRSRRPPEKSASPRDHGANERATRIVSPSRETKRLLEGIGTPRKTPFKPDPFQLEALASLEYDRDTWQAGEDFRCGLWVINDHWYAIPGARVRWKIVKSNGAVINNGELVVNIAEDSSTKLTDLRWRAAGVAYFRAQLSRALDLMGIAVPPRM